MDSLQEAKTALIQAWPAIQEECLGVLGSELHYQAMIYHCLRQYGAVPKNQLGMNVKMWIREPVTELFQKLAVSKRTGYQTGFEPIPDVVIFDQQIDSDWRRRNQEKTLLHMFIAIEVKASERMNGRLRPKEITTDIEKLVAHRTEAQHRGGQMLPVMLIIDSAPLENERMTSEALKSIKQIAAENRVELLYCARGRSYSSFDDVG
ncbi:hypothetical protein [Endozoicomonas sp.]|uniref:hypothetical protein n=1 Tax=Endozoicomonas sp. TaxID=1892382 RepID=UPI003AF92956